MTQGEFKEKKRLLVKARNEAERFIAQMERDYIKMNKQFEIGEEVKLIYKNRPPQRAFVRNVGVHDDGSIYYAFNGIKKDGTMSSTRLKHDVGELILIEKL